MKKLILLAVLLAVASPLSAQRYKAFADTATVDDATVVSYGMGNVSNALEVLGWYIYNMDDADTLLVNLDGTDPTTANAVWVEPNKALSISFPGIREIRILYVNNNGVVHTVMTYKQGR